MSGKAERELNAYIAKMEYLLLRTKTKLAKFEKDIANFKREVEREP